MTAHLRLYTLASAMLLGWTAASAQIVWLQKEHDFGAFKEDMGIVNCTLQAVNSGTEPIAITNVRTTCGCTRPTYSTEPVAPGDTISIKVGFNPSGRPGKFTKYVHVTSDDNHKYTLAIKGTVIGASNTLSSRFPIEAGPARLSNTVIPFGTILKGHTSAQHVKIYNSSSHTISPKVVKHPSYIHAMIEPASIPAGEQGVISLVAYSDKNPAWGLSTDSLTIVPDTITATDEVALSTVMILNEDFSNLTERQLADAPGMSLDSDVIDLGRITDSNKKIKRTFTIANTGRSPLLIRDISTPDRAIQLAISSRSIKHGKKATVTVTIDPKAVHNHKIINARITIISNTPARPTEIVRVVGEIA